MTQFNEWQEVEVATLSDGARPFRVWRKAKIIRVIPSTPWQMIIEFPDGTRAAFGAEYIRSVCKYGDPLCPCPDGDPCHYEGKNPMTPPVANLDSTR